MSEDVFNTVLDNFGGYLYDQKLKSLEPGYVAETGILLATEPSTLKFYSYDFKRF